MVLTMDIICICLQLVNVAVLRHFPDFNIYPEIQCGHYILCLQSRDPESSLAMLVSISCWHCQQEMEVYKTEPEFPNHDSCTRKLMHPIIFYAAHKIHPIWGAIIFKICTSSKMAQGKP